MPREARNVFADIPHHITQRGNNRQDIFFTDTDRRFYLQTLKTESLKHGLQIDAYCLMTNHIHLLAVPREPDSLANALGRTHFKYTQYINRFHRRSGHLWQNRFYSCPVDGTSCGMVTWYIETNPVRARMVRQAWQYEWSSAQAHTGGQDTSGLLDLEAWRHTYSPEAWRSYLRERIDENGIETIRARTSRGRPLGSDSFISKLETIAGRRLRALPNGRPKKEK